MFDMRCGIYFRMKRDKRVASDEKVASNLPYVKPRG